MATAPAHAARESEIKRPFIRIRHVLLLLLLGLAANWAYPRAQSAWRLHSLATQVADYGLCMVGPTGPALLRDNPDGFRALVRRRLVSSSPNETPFEKCAEGAQEVTGSADTLAVHRAPAGAFEEYGDFGVVAKASQHTLDELGVSIEPVAEASARAWPFVRGGYTRLVRPSRHAEEAVHPVAPPTPVLGSGLPNWRARYRAVLKTQKGFVVAFGQGANLSTYETLDRGINWKPVSSHHKRVSEFAERCPIDVDGRSFVFSLSDDLSSISVSSLGPDGPPFHATLGPADQGVVAAACDAEGLVALVQSGAKNDEHARAKLWFCPFRRRCAAMPPPDPGLGDLPLPADVARVSGTTVVAVTRQGIVRVASSRDGGRSWTPFSVAYDSGEQMPEAMGLPAPGRLLALDDRLVLYGGAQRPDQAYLVLASDDGGASWHTPRPPHQRVARGDL